VTFRDEFQAFGRWLFSAVIFAVVIAVVVGLFWLWLWVGNGLDPGCPSGSIELEDGRCVFSD